MRTQQEILNDISETERRLVSLKDELSQVPKYNWDDMTSEELLALFNDNSLWNAWGNCPVGSLIKERNRDYNPPEDFILRKLGVILQLAIDGDWKTVVFYIREITRFRLDEIT